MLKIDDNLIGRKYITTDPNVTYTIRGIYVQPNTRPIVIGEYALDPTDVSSKTGLVTHQLAEIKML